MRAGDIATAGWVDLQHRLDPYRTLVTHESPQDGALWNVLNVWNVRFDVAEIELQPQEVWKRNPVDEDLRRTHVATVIDVPLQPEEDVVPTPRYVISFVPKR